MLLFEVVWYASAIIVHNVVLRRVHNTHNCRKIKLIAQQLPTERPICVYCKPACIVCSLPPSLYNYNHIMPCFSVDFFSCGCCCSGILMHIIISYTRIYMACMQELYVLIMNIAEYRYEYRSCKHLVDMHKLYALIFIMQ